MNTLHRSYIPSEWSQGVDHLDIPYFTFSDFLTEAECDIVTGWGDLQELSDGVIMRDQNKNLVPSIRKSKISWLPVHGWDWIYDKIYSSVESTNKWAYDVRGFGELIQFTDYDSTEGDSFYTSHKDTGPGFHHRKISFVILLDDPKNFDGGDLILDNVGKLNLPSKGSAVMFPAFMHHQVTPVTSGRRRTLVSWVAGPKLK